MGRGLALALERAGARVRALGRVRRPAEALDAAGVLIATPGAAIESAAAGLGRDRAVGPAQVVLHLSGLLDRLALGPLAGTGAGLGSFHPLQSVADPATAPERLRDAFAALEGDDRALDTGQALAEALG